jgi:1-acyl-sn-glycerol-3-phosphate acyltransferase
VPIALNSGLYWPRRRFLRFPGKVRVEALDPIMPGRDRNAFFADLEQKLEAATAQLIAEGLRELGEAGRAHFETAQSQG